MKANNTIQIIETPIIDKYDFHENNGIINPAFLELHPEEEDNSSSRSLVDTDYRHTFQQKNSSSPVHYPIEDLTIQPRPNGLAIASSWVYEFNNPSSSSLPNQSMTSSQKSINGIYRSASGLGYNEHLSYEMDLNRDHRINNKKQSNDGCGPDRCWPKLIRLFVWAVIVVCLMGVLFSVAFIIYIEKFAKDSCCDEPAPDSGHIPNYQFGFNATTLGIVNNSTPGLTTSGSDSISYQSTGLPEVVPIDVSKLSTNLLSDTTIGRSLSDLLTTPISSMNSGQNHSEVVSVADVSPIIFETHITTAINMLTETTPAPTSPTTKPINMTSETTSKSTFEPRVLATLSSQRPASVMVTAQTRPTDQINVNGSDGQQLNATPFTTVATKQDIDSSALDMDGSDVTQLEHISTPAPNMTTSANLFEATGTPSIESYFNQANYNQTEPGIDFIDNLPLNQTNQSTVASVDPITTIVTTDASSNTESVGTSESGDSAFHWANSTRL